MLKITFYPNDEARIVGDSVTNDGKPTKEKMTTTHFRAEVLRQTLQEQSREGTIEAQIVTIRKSGAYTIPKLERVNSIFGVA